jgi:hypothetical protein
MSELTKSEKFFRRISYFTCYPLACRQQRLMADRTTYSKLDFLNRAQTYAIEPKIAEIVWARMILESSIVELTFKPKMEDLLGEDFGRHNEDIRDLVCELAVACDKTPEDWNIIDVDKLITIGDMLAYINQLPNEAANRRDKINRLPNEAGRSFL